MKFRESFLSSQLTSEALVMLVATELRVGDMAADVTSSGLAVTLLKRCWFMKGKLVLDPEARDE